MTCPPGRSLLSFLADPGTTFLIFSKLATVQRKTNKEHKKNPDSLPVGFLPIPQLNLCLSPSHLHHAVSKTAPSLLSKIPFSIAPRIKKIIFSKLRYDTLSSMTPLSIHLRALHIPDSLITTHLSQTVNKSVQAAKCCHHDPSGVV